MKKHLNPARKFLKHPGRKLHKYEDMLPLAQIWEGYTPEQAAKDGCVLTEPGYGDVLHGSDMLSKYLTATKRRAEPSELKIAIVKDGVVSLIKECVFDGEIYTVTSAATDDLGAVIIETKTYSHMLKDICHYDNSYYYLLLRK